MCLIENERIRLIPYTHADDVDMYACWQAIETRRGYNSTGSLPFHEFAAQNIGQFRFWVTVIDKESGARVGSLRLGLEEVCSDLAIWIYPKYRNQGYGSTAFELSLQYIFAHFDFPELFAECCENDAASQRILFRLRFVHVPELDALEDDCFSGGKIIQREYRIRKNEFVGFRGAFARNLT